MIPIMQYYKVYDYVGCYPDEYERVHPRCIYITDDKDLAYKIAKIAAPEKYGKPFVEQVDTPHMNTRFSKDTSVETLKEWYRTEKDGYAYE